jgi:hypothetical protein
VNIIRVTTSRRIWWVGNSTLIEMKKGYRILDGKPEGKQSLVGNLTVDERIILKVP